MSLILSSFTFRLASSARLPIPDFKVFYLLVSSLLVDTPSSINPITLEQSALGSRHSFHSITEICPHDPSFSSQDSEYFACLRRASVCAVVCIVVLSLIHI